VTEQRNYRIVYMLPASMDEQSVDEFIQKFEAEVVQQSGFVQSTSKSKQQMVKTTVNKGARNVYLITTFATASAPVIAELNRYLKLAQGVVLNFLILKEEKVAVKA
jgi:ribosomal protein S6